VSDISEQLERACCDAQLRLLNNLAYILFSELKV